jgi:two-component system sensor histidine kinase DegS
MEITRAQEEERKRIARELHDETAQSLAALMLDIESIINTKERLSKNILNKLERIRGKADDIMQGVRRFSTEMRPGVLDQLGLVAALGWLADSIGDGISARVELIGGERRLISEAELVLFRITQEALNNVRRHSQATQVLITVEFAPKKVKLEVKDNGKGFELPKNLEDFAVSGSLGILGMHERARIIAGNFSIQSKPGLGTVVSIEVAK